MHCQCGRRKQFYFIFFMLFWLSLILLENESVHNGTSGDARITESTRWRRTLESSPTVRTTRPPGRSVPSCFAVLGAAGDSLKHCAEYLSFQRSGLSTVFRRLILSFRRGRKKRQLQLCHYSFGFAHGAYARHVHTPPNTNGFFSSFFDELDEQKLIGK